MSFRIPSLEEARRRQELNAASYLVLPPTNRSAVKTKQDGNTNSVSLLDKQCASRSVTPQLPNDRSGNGTSSVSAGTATTSQRPLQPINPYAKKGRASPRAAVTSVNGKNHSDGASQPLRTALSNNAAATRNPAPSSVGRAPTYPTPVITNVGPSATFSQAFGSVEDTAQYAQELHYIQQKHDIGKTSISSASETERAQQRAVDTEVAIETQQQVNDSADARRENHLLLQPHVLHVSTKQRGNGVLRHIRNVPFAYSTMIPDYIMGINRCTLFLSLRYHSLHPTYIHRRISELRTNFDLRVLLCLVDVDDNASALLVLNKLSVLNNMSLILAWSDEEAARYLETFKAYENRDSSSIQKREKDTFAEQIADVLSTVRSINRTDSSQLLSQFCTLKSLISAPMDELALCPGIGEKKVRRLYDAFNKPFSSAAAKKRRNTKFSDESSLQIIEEHVALDGKSDNNCPASDAG